MRRQINETRERHDFLKDSVILHFDKIDSEIVRHWSEPKTKDMFDEEK